MTETLIQEQAINQKYDRLSKLLITGVFLTSGLGLSGFIGFGWQVHNHQKNPYNILPIVVEYAETRQRLQEIEGPGFCLRQIAERNPNLIDASKVDLYVSGLEMRLETL